MKAIKPTTDFTQESSMAIPYNRTYHVDTKTGKCNNNNIQDENDMFFFRSKRIFGFITNRH
jgi:hypothetical protein